jgi:ABC-2 type transport system permease protein
MVITLGIIMGFRPAAGFVGVVLAVALIIVFAMSLSWMWIIVGMLVKSPESVMTSSFLLLFPLTMASNIFVDPRTMPRLLQVLVSVNPVSHLATASRGLMHGDVRMSDVVYVLVATVVITAIFAPIAMRMYHRER